MGAGPRGLLYKNKNFTTLFAALDQTNIFLEEMFDGVAQVFSGLCASAPGHLRTFRLD